MERNQTDSTTSNDPYNTTATTTLRPAQQQLESTSTERPLLKPQPHGSSLTEWNYSTMLTPGEASVSSPASLLHNNNIETTISQPPRDDKGIPLDHHHQQQRATSLNFIETISPSSIQYSSPAIFDKGQGPSKTWSGAGFQQASTSSSSSTIPLVTTGTPQFYGDSSEKRIDSLQLVPFEADHEMEEVDIHTTEEDTSTLQTLRRRSSLLARPSKHVKLYFGLAIAVAMLVWMVPCLSLLPLLAFYGYFKNSHNPRERKFARFSKKAIYFLILFDVIMFIVLFVSVIIYVLAKERNKPNFNLYQ
ncbi:hypothetical protein C9374_014181 [Naegleria lovaniensis]|uniref:Uncharacterized protein n=1 Tax=Naegleria lovaniensis TaxID=51637 RepID=A0AA88KQE9_NAELO|nr:uncharacterized protein C9374_014181 [Naegleria lovaniensis]KAG2389621.1 hypothetical protein C9374_014181 [Naegleria lovaniensis]